MASDFFIELPKITDFMGVIDESNFYPVPQDWMIVVTDIKSSTDAVAQGQYKDVNMIGSSAICAVQNATGFRHWPFVFGGDGATMLLESSHRKTVEAALVRTRTLAADEFDLTLRIGIVPVRDVLDLGAQVLVARYEVSPENSYAMFGGGGVELADELIKSGDTAARYLVPEYTLPGLPDLTGLSCRWESIGSEKGSILSLLVKPLASDFHTRQVTVSQFLDKLTTIIGADLRQANPVRPNALQFSWPPKGLSTEAKLTRGSKSYRRRLLEIYINSFIQWLLERFKLSGGGYDAKAYRDELLQNSDYCRYDDTLRMVLDCTPDQLVDICNLMDSMQSEGDVEAGYFESKQAQITCLLFDLHSSQHLHFVDGENGGLCSASKVLKQQSV